MSRGWLPGRLVRSLVALLALVVVASACGLPLDETPREFARSEIPPQLLPGTLPPPTPAFDPGGGIFSLDQIHMIGPDNRLEAVARPAVSTAIEAIETLLLATTTEEADVGISTAITRGTRIPTVEVNALSDVATVHLTAGSLDAQRSEQRLAFAQIVFTLTSLEGIDTVTFVEDTADESAEPRPLALQTDLGTTLPGVFVTRNDYALLAPVPNVAAPAFDQPTATPVPAVVNPNAVDVPVWMVDDQRLLVQVSRRIERTQEDILLALLGGFTAEERRDLGITSALPPDAEAQSIETRTFEIVPSEDEPGSGDGDEDQDQGPDEIVRTNIAFVDLVAGSLPPVGDSDRVLAVAQIVFTLTGLVEIDQVVFLVDGVQTPMQTEQGLALPFFETQPRGLTRLDFATLAPDITIVPPPGVTPTPVVTPEPTPDA